MVRGSMATPVPTMNGKPDVHEMRRALRLMVGADQVIEVRVPGADQYGKVASGYFNDLDAAVDAAREFGSAKGVYYTMNPCDPALLSRASNRMRLCRKGDPTTADHDIAHRRWLFVDIDPNRPAGISSTDVEHDAAITKAGTMLNTLRDDLGWPEGIVASSGNGAYLLYRIDLPTDDEGLVERTLRAMAARFNDDAVKIDTGNFNPARIIKIIGTYARKGDNTRQRPHRQSRFIHTPATLGIVSADQLTEFCEDALDDEPQPTPSRNGKLPRGFNIEDFIVQHSLQVTGPKQRRDGRSWEFPVCPFNPDRNDGAAFIIEMAGGMLRAGCKHNSCTWGWRDLRLKFDPTCYDRKSKPGETAATGTRSKPSGPVVVCMADVKAESVDWLWEGRIVRGMLNLFVGDPGLGKSFITLDMAARVSTGSVWPDGAKNGPAGGVVLLSAEDDPGRTIRPRLDAMGANVSRISLLKGVRTFDPKSDDDKGRVRLFTLDDIPPLETAIKQTDDCKLVIIDPVSAYLGKVDSNNNADVRFLIHPLVELAANYGVALVAVSHLRKGEGPAMYRAIGSLAFAAAARTAWAVAKCPDDPTGRRRLFLPIKNNLAEDATGMAYRINRPAPFSAPVVEWEPDPIVVTADDVIGQMKRGPNRDAIEEAMDWLKDILADGPVPAKQASTQANDDGITAGTLKRAKKELGVKSSRDGFGGAWSWKLPEANSARRGAGEPIYKTVRPFGGTCAPSGESEAANGNGEPGDEALFEDGPRVGGAVEP